MDAAFSLNRFEKNGANGGVEFRFQIGEIVEANKLDSRNHGRKRQPIFLGGGDADGSKGASMKGVLQGEETMLLSRRSGQLLRRAPGQTRELHCSVDRFGPAIRKEHAIHTGPFGELARQRALKRV